MFHYSGRLAGLDDMVLKISSPSKIACAISKSALDGEPYLKVKKVQKRKARQATRRPPLTDKTFVNNAVPDTPSRPQRKSLEKPVIIEKSRGQQGSILPPDEPVTSVKRSQHNIESLHPLPQLPSTSTLQLPSFLNFSTTLSFSPSLLADQCPPKSPESHSLPASLLFSRSSSQVSVRPAVIRKTKNAKVYEGPQWIPAFHSPNSPYVPWPSPKRRRIFRPLTPESPIHSPLYSRTGAVAPEPWSSQSSSETQANVEKCSNSWKGFMKSVRSGLRGVKSGISRIGKVQRLSRRRADLSMPSCGNDISARGDVVSEENLPRNFQSPQEDTSGSRFSFCSIVSSDSTTLAAWLAERRSVADTSCECPGMSLEEYEISGSWLDLRRGYGDWACGVPDCDVHTPNGSIGALWHRLRFFRTTLPFDDFIHERHVHETPVPEKISLPVPTVDSSMSPPFGSYPMPPAQMALMSQKLLETPGETSVERLLMSKKSRELNIPGGWMLTS